MKRDELSPVKLSIILFLIAGFSGCILSLVYSVTESRIKENERLEEQASIKIIMPAVKSFKQEKDCYLIYNSKKKLIGYIFKTESRGYGGLVKCSVGIDFNGKITGVKVASHKETPGLGSRIEETRKKESEPYFTAQFKDLAKEQVEGVEKITGATVSSKAVIKCVKQAFKKWGQIKESRIKIIRQDSY